MIALEIFTFETPSRTFTVEAVNPVQAFCAANLNCTQAGETLPQGVWADTLRARVYRFTPGNFFD